MENSEVSGRPRVGPSFSLENTKGAIVGERIIGTVDGTRADARTESGRPGLCRQIREDYHVHGRDWSRPGFRALAVHRFGVWRARIGWKILRWPLWRIYLLLFRYVRNHYGIEIPLSVEIGRRCYIGHQHGIVLHRLVKIGDDCILRHNVTIGGYSRQQHKRVPTIGNRVEIGCGATIIGDIHVGDGAVIGANSLVRTDVPSGALAVGNPARIIQRGAAPEPVQSIDREE
jgi:serine O-acetyltransferase